MTNWNQIPNSVGLRRAYAGTEVQAGTAVTPTFRLYGNMRLDPKRPLSDREEFAGTYFGDYSPVWGPLEITGTYEQALFYEDLPILLRYGLVGGVTGATDGEGTPGYLYEHKPSADKIDLDTMSLEYGTPGMPWASTCVFFEGFTISGDIDDSEAAWKWSSPVRACTHALKADVNDTATGGSTSTVIKAAAGWTINAYQGAYVRMLTGTAGNIGQVRRILSNDATTLTIDGLFPAAVANTDTFEISGTFTSGIADRTREVIDAPGTVLYLDTATLGTTLQSGRFISFSVTYEGNASLKRFMENVDSYAPRIDQGKKRVTGQVRLEFDNRDEYDAWKAQTVRKIRIQQQGSAINAHATLPNKLARIDIFAGYWGEYSVDERNNNITATWQFRGYVDSSEASPFEITVKNAVSANP